jgi:type IV pilus assembly protein PilB
MTRELEDSIIKNVQASDMLKVARKDGFKTMQEIARDFIRKGILSIEEYQSALNLEH